MFCRDKTVYFHSKSVFCHCIEVWNNKIITSFDKYFSDLCLLHLFINHLSNFITNVLIFKDFFVVHHTLCDWRIKAFFNFLCCFITSSTTNHKWICVEIISIDDIFKPIISRLCEFFYRFFCKEITLNVLIIKTRKIIWFFFVYSCDTKYMFILFKEIHIFIPRLIEFCHLELWLCENNINIFNIVFVSPNINNFTCLCNFVCKLMEIKYAYKTLAPRSTKNEARRGII